MQIGWTVLRLTQICGTFHFVVILLSCVISPDVSNNVQIQSSQFSLRCIYSVGCCDHLQESEDVTKFQTRQVCLDYWITPGRFYTQWQLSNKDSDSHNTSVYFFILSRTTFEVYLFLCSFLHGPSPVNY